MPIITPKTPAAFNGGTITNPLTISTGATADELIILGTHTDFRVDGFGDLTFVGDQGITTHLGATGINNTASLSLSGTDGGNSVLNTSDGLSLSIADGTVFQIQDAHFLVGGCTAAPNDAVLSASQFALWLDATPGATKLMVKAKDSGGTVRTAAIALA